MMKKIKAHDFQKFKTAGFFGRDIWNGIITLELRLEKQANFEKKKIALTKKTISKKAFII